MFNGLYDGLNKQKELENLIKNYQQPQDLYELKKLNKEDEAENIFISTNTLFLGTNRMQIKKLDGTIEKYNIERYYPIDEKDEMIKELNKKVEDLERKLNNEHAELNISNRELNKSNRNDDEYVECKPKTTSKSISRKD